mgnify:FL=1
MAPWKNSPPLKRFYEKCIPEPNTGCWLWLGTLHMGGYGELSVSGKVRRAHDYSYETFVEPVPFNLCVLHTCDMRCCVNPEHLYVGTKQNNADDCNKRNRRPRGIGHGMTTLTEAQVRAIRVDPRKQKQIAADYGVGQMTISNIKRRATWGHVP